MRSTWPSYFILLHLTSKYYAKKNYIFYYVFFSTITSYFLHVSPTEFIYLEEIYEISIRIVERWAEDMKVTAQLGLLSSLLFEHSRCLHFGFFFQKQIPLLISAVRLLSSRALCTSFQQTSCLTSSFEISTEPSSYCCQRPSGYHMIPFLSSFQSLIPTLL
jgi:hypothetical protein